MHTHTQRLYPSFACFQQAILSGAMSHHYWCDIIRGIYQRDLHKWLSEWRDPLVCGQRSRHYIQISKKDARHWGRLLIYTQVFLLWITSYNLPAKPQLNIQLQILKLFWYKHVHLNRLLFFSWHSRGNHLTKYPLNALVRVFPSLPKHAIPWKLNPYSRNKQQEISVQRTPSFTFNSDLAIHT